MSRSAKKGFYVEESLFKKIMAKDMPIGRLGTDDEIASLIKFLLSDICRFISSTTNTCVS